MGSAEQTILVTGGAGFIGSHTVVQLLHEGFSVSIIDNLDNSVIEAVDRVKELVGPALSKKLHFHLVWLFFLSTYFFFTFTVLGVFVSGENKRKFGKRNFLEMK